jgi:hypothetical protein
MFASIEVLIGLALVYLLLALIVTAFTEWFSSLFRYRARNLRTAVQQMLDGPAGTANTQRFFSHPRIVALSEGIKPPSYVPAKAFAEVVKELADSAREGSAAMPMLGGDSPNVEQIEERFLDTMNRASGWYKRKAIVISVFWAAVVVVFANADTLAIAHKLWASPLLREAVVAQAERRVAMGAPRPIEDARYPNPEDPVPDASEESAEEQGDEANQLTAEDRQLLDSLMGWSSDYRAINDPFCEKLQAERDTNCLERGDQAACDALLTKIAEEDRCETKQGALVATGVHPGTSELRAATGSIVFDHLFGWLLSIAAVSLGAPFWFDTLSRFVNLRGAGPAERPKNKGDNKSTNEEKK